MGVMKSIVTDILELHDEGYSVNDIAERMGQNQVDVGFIVTEFTLGADFEVPGQKVTSQEVEFDDIPF